MAAENTLKYVKLDHTAYRNAMLARVRAQWPLAWNDFLASSFGRVLVDLVAWALSVLAYVVNRLAAENFIPTMTLRESAVRVGALASYKLKNPIAATVMCEARLSEPATEAVKLAQGTTINVTTETGAGVTYELAADYTIAVGDSEPMELVLAVDPFATGDLAINTRFTAAKGSEYLDLVDPTIDLSLYVTPGQYVVSNADTTETAYRIIEITATPTSQQLSRLVIDPPWIGSDATTPSGTVDQFSATITERRVRFTQGQRFTERYTVPPVNSPNHTVKLTRQPVIENSVTVTVDGTIWPIVPSLAVQDGDAQVAEIKMLNDGYSAVVFGDSLFGATPPSDATISVTYRVGGGIIGNIAVGTINTTIIGQQSAGQQVITVTNSWSPGEGGTDAESLNEARNNIPAHIRCNDRGVTAGDYQVLASNYNHTTYGQVRHARVVPATTNALLESNAVVVYAWTTGPTGGLIPLSAGLKSALTTYLRSKAIGTDYVTVKDGAQIPAAFALRCKVVTGFDLASVETSIDAALTDIVNSAKPDDAIIFSDTVSVLDRLNGVDTITMATPLSDLSPRTATEIFVPPDSTYEWPVPLTLLDSYTYTGQIPVSPLTAWCFKIYADGQELLVIPDTKAGFARVVGNSTNTGIADYNVGVKANRPTTLTALNVGDFYYATDEQQLYRVNAVSTGSGSITTLNWTPVATGGSFVNLHTGQLTISFKGTRKDITLKLITTQCYDTERTINLHIGYTGTNSVVKRHEVRAALRSWAAGFKIGGSIFASAVTNTAGETMLAASRANVTDVVLSVPGVTSVNKVTFDSPSNNATRLDATATELFKLGAITINGLTD